MFSLRIAGQLALSHMSILPKWPTGACPAVYKIRVQKMPVVINRNKVQ